ncbi:MAG: TonB-dependent receptor [Alphaproteobacteria bacterium]|nr:TonB-dependent receptor [Alphaproteobacteria bacterium]
MQTNRPQYMRSSALWVVGAVAAGAVLAPAAVLAQADEIVVQARKRAESLQNIPVSGSVLGEQAIQDIGGIIDPVQLGEYLTAVQVDEEGNAEYFIRGAGSGRNPLADSATTQLRNGANTAGGFGGRAFQNIDQFDTKQIEVYRGAQGALYGRSAVGGVINVVNQEPMDIFEYRGLADYNVERERYRGEAIVNVPLVDNRLFFRGGVQFLDDGGLWENRLPLFNIDEDKARHFQRTGGRVGLRWLINESMDATLYLDHESVNAPSLLNNRQVTVDDDRLAGAGAGVVLPDGSPAPTAISFPIGGDYYVQHQDTPGSFDQGLTNLFLQVNADLPFATFTSLTNIRNRTYDFLLDADASYVGGPRNGGARCAGTMAASGRTTQMCESKTNSESFIGTQEFRLVSTADGPFQWIAGVDYRWFENPIIDELFGFREGPASFIINRRHDIDQKNQEYGAFGSLSYDITDALQLGASVRYTYIDKEYQQVTTSNDSITPPGTVALDRDQALIFRNLSPSVHLSYDLAGGPLVYVSWAQAFRPGGFNRTQGVSNGGEVVGFEFQEELANSYEVGVKGDTRFDIGRSPGTFRYSVSAFYIDYNGVLQNAAATTNDPTADPDADGTGVSQANNLLNVGDAWVRGVEADLGGSVRDFFGTGGRLTWQGGLSFSESKIYELSSFAAPTRQDDHLAELPQWTWNGNFTYRRPLPFFENTGLGLFANTNFSYEVGRHQQAQVKRGNTQRWNARLGVEGETHGVGWQLIGYMDNVFDVEYQRARVANGCNQGAFDGPLNPGTLAPNGTGPTARCVRVNDRATWGLRLTFRGQ